MRTSAKLILMSTMVFLAAGTGAAQSDNPKLSPNEVELQQRLSDKRYSFDALLRGNPADIANAERVFVLTDDPERKLRIASILLSLGVKDKAYADYLERNARAALADETPWPILWDDQDKQSWNPVFVEWCKQGRHDPWDNLERVQYEVPIPWYYLASAGYQGSYNLLIEGLHSHNEIIVATAAEGLARLQQADAVDELITVGRTSRGAARSGIGRALLYFEVPRAQDAANEFIRNKKLLELQREEARRRGPKGLFQW